MPDRNDARISGMYAPGWRVHTETLSPEPPRLLLPGIRAHRTHAVRLVLTRRTRRAAADLLLRVRIEGSEVVAVANEGGVEAGTDRALLARTRESDSINDRGTELELAIELPTASPLRLLVVWYLPTELAASDDGGPRAAPPPMAAPEFPEEGVALERINSRDVVDAFIAADLPPVLQVGVAVALTVRLAREGLTDVTGHRNAQDAIRIDPQRTVHIKLRRRNLRVVPGTPDRLDITCPAAGQTATGTFHVIGVEPGDAVALLAVFQTETFPLATLRLDVTVTTDPVADITSLVTGTAAVERLDPRLRDLPVLAVDEDVVAGESTLTFELKLPSGKRRSYATRVRPDKAGYLARLYERIEALWARHEVQPTVAARRRAFDADLEQYGLELAADFLPGALRADLETDWSRLDGLAVVTTESDIPWELVAVEVDDGDGPRPRFLAENGMTRWLCDGAHPIVLTLRRGHRRFLCPNYRNTGYRLPHLELERDLLTDILEADEIIPGNADELGRQLRTRTIDLLHFGGHGDVELRDGNLTQRLLLADFDDNNPSETTVYHADRLAEDYARPSAAGRQSRPSGPSDPCPIVVLNACSVGRNARTGVEAFVPALIAGGAGAVLGCLWRIEDDAATDFVRAFYAELRGHRTVAQALAAARATVRRQGNASWLAYTLYAHPLATVDFDTSAADDREDEP